MVDIERSSPAARKLRSAAGHRLRHAPCEHLPRHRHESAFAALVLRGGYVEAGDAGRYRLEAGDVLLHSAFESHLDRFDARGAEVLVLPEVAAHFIAGRVPDADAIARLAERDPSAAAEALVRTAVPKPAVIADWPDLLAQSMRENPSLCLRRWADEAHLHLGSVSRGFRGVFGMTPMRYRLIQRTRRAIDALESTRLPLSDIAQNCGFADQAHMSRAIARVARLTPAALRRRAGR